MDITFITMHDLTVDARVLYASDSIGDVLGYNPQDVTGKSCFEYFHPDEVPFAKAVHGRGVHLDKAAVLSYCSLKRMDGVYVRCECVFTVVYSVIVACTSLYRYNDKSHGRAEAAPLIRRAFSSTRKDPRYHMLTHLSTKFTTPINITQAPNDDDDGNEEHEPRAALILNRFTRTLTIMYATHALHDILGVQAEDAIGRSFYECISEDCLQDAVDALERAKENDSIAYLRFQWRNPVARNDGGNNQRNSNSQAGQSGVTSGNSSIVASTTNAGNSSGEDDDEENNTPDYSRRSPTTPQTSISGSAGGSIAAGEEEAEETIEVEAVVSCTSDGLVVIARRAQCLFTPPIPTLATGVRRTRGRGVFASPWALVPLIPEGPAAAVSQDPASIALQQADFMESIRQVGVFAWSLRSINSDVTTKHAKPGPLPDSADKVGEFGKPSTSTHWKRLREWEETLEKEEGGYDPQYPTTGNSSNEDTHNNKRHRV